MKLLVQTNGEFGLYDLLGRQEIHAYRPCVVEATPFINVNIGAKLTVLEELADEASDAELAAAGTDEALEAAIAALPRREKPAPKAAAPKPAKKV